VSQTFDQSLADWVLHKHKHDWDRIGDPLNLDRTESVYSDNYVGLCVNEFSRQYSEPFRIFGRKTMFQMNVFSFNIAKIVEGFH